MNVERIGSVEFAKALADETRQEIMRICCCKWLSVNDIVSELSVSQPTVSHHLAILRRSNLVKQRREGKQVFYTLNQSRLADGCCVLAEDFAPEFDLHSHS